MELRARSGVFVGVSLAAHVALFAGLRPAVHAPARAAGGSSMPGGSAAIGGDTFEVPPVEEAPRMTPEGDVASDLGADDPAAPPDEQDRTRTVAIGGAAASRHARSHPSSPAPPPPEPAAYGALGDRSAGDLVATFKRTFPVAASSDPLWNRVPVGFYADGDVTFTLDADGSLEAVTTSPNAAPAFVAAIARTTTLLRHRLFTARGAVTRLHVVVRVSGELVNHGAFTINAAGSFELPSGRHVSVSLTER